MTYSATLFLELLHKAWRRILEFKININQKNSIVIMINTHTFENK